VKAIVLLSIVVAVAITSQDSFVNLTLEIFTNCPAVAASNGKLYNLTLHSVVFTLTAAIT
jgi:hypothetical protein